MIVKKNSHCRGGQAGQGRQVGQGRQARAGRWARGINAILRRQHEEPGPREMQADGSIEPSHSKATRPPSPPAQAPG